MPDLIPAEPWTVVAKSEVTGPPDHQVKLPPHLITWQLCHLGRSQMTLRGPNALATLQQTARQFNAAKVLPSRPVKCFADIPGEAARMKEMIAKAL